MIHAYKNATATERAFLAEAAKDGELAAGRVGEIISLINKYDGLGHASKMAERYAVSATMELESLPSGIHSMALAGLAEYIIHRTH